MLSKTLQKSLSALHVWVYVPFPDGVSQELAHSIEHRVFLDPEIAALEDGIVRHNGMTYWTGIQLEFTVPPQKWDELRRAVESLFSKPLPKMSFEERERFARELEGGGGDAFDAALDRFKTVFYEENDWKHSGKDEEEIWGSLEFSAIRFLSIGQDKAILNDAWTPKFREGLRFPVLKEELKPEEGFRPHGNDPGENGNDDDFEDVGIDPRDAPMDYVLLFPSVIANTEDFAFHSLFFQFLRLKTDTEFRDTGRTYDPIAEDYFENGFAVSGLHLITSDRDKRLPNLPKKPDRATFDRAKESLAFQTEITHDQLSFGQYPVLGIDPTKSAESIRRFRYDDFVREFDAAGKRVSILWERG